MQEAEARRKKAAKAQAAKHQAESTHAGSRGEEKERS